MSLKNFLEYKTRIKKFEKGYGQRTRNLNLPDNEVYLNVENITFNEIIIEDKDYFLSFLKKNHIDTLDKDIPSWFFLYYNVNKNEILNKILEKENNFILFSFINSKNIFYDIFFINIFEENIENIFFKNKMQSYFEKKIFSLKFNNNNKLYNSLLIIFKKLLHFILFFLNSKFKFFFFDFVNVYLSLYIFIDKKNLLFSFRMRILKILKMNAFTLYIDFVELRFKHLTDYRIKRQETFNKSYFTFLKEIKKNKMFFLWIFQKKFINKFFYTDPKYSMYYDIYLVDYEVFYKAFMEFTKIKNKFVFILNKYNNNVLNIKNNIIEKRKNNKKTKYLNFYKYSLTEEYFNNLIF